MSSIESTAPDMTPRLFSIGHSNHAIDVFLGFLRRHAIEVVVDVRSEPYSKYAPHFNGGPLKAALSAAGIKYLFFGKELGGHPSDPAFYDADGHVVYERMAATPAFREGLKRLQEGAAKYRVAILCGEEDPAYCHRRQLIGRALAKKGVRLDHIRGDGHVQTEEDLILEETGGQGDLFADVEDAPQWRRSIQSVSQKKARPSSSKP